MNIGGTRPPQLPRDPALASIRNPALADFPEPPTGHPAHNRDSSHQATTRENAVADCLSEAPQADEVQEGGAPQSALACENALAEFLPEIPCASSPGGREPAGAAAPGRRPSTARSRLRDAGIFYGVLKQRINPAFWSGVVVGGLAVWLIVLAFDDSGSDRPGTGVATALAAGEDAAVPTQVAAPIAGRERSSDEAASGTRPNESRTAATFNQASSVADTPRPQVVPRPRPVQFRGSLIIRSNPSGAQVVLNGRSVGVTPVVLRNQAIGSRAVKITLPGYSSWNSAVRVIADQQTLVYAQLHPE